MLTDYRMHALTPMGRDQQNYTYLYLKSLIIKNFYLIYYHGYKDMTSNKLKSEFSSEDSSILNACVKPIKHKNVKHKK